MSRKPKPIQPAPKASKKRADAKAFHAREMAHSPSRKHNASYRKEMAVKAWAGLERIQDRLVELREQAKGFREQLKECGFSSQSIALIGALKKIPVGKRAEVVDDVQEQAEALGLGKQLSLFGKDEEDDGDKTTISIKARNGNGHRAPPPAPDTGAADEMF